jgi:hypothetical protein
MTSSDGRNWTLRTAAAANNWTALCWTAELGLFVAVSSSGKGNRVMTSTDGISWSSHSSAADNALTSLCWSPQRRTQPRYWTRLLWWPCSTAPVDLSVGMEHSIKAALRTDKDPWSTRAGTICPGGRAA